MQTAYPAVNAQSRGSLMTDLLIGAAAGAVASWVMTKFDSAMYEHADEQTRARTTAARPFGQPPARVAVMKAAGAADRPLSPEQVERYGQAVHYGLGVMPAMAYAALYDRVPALSAGRGSLFGLAVFLMQDEVLNSGLGLGGRPRDYPWQAHARGLVAHIVFGMVTDAIVGVAKSRLDSSRSGVKRPHQLAEPSTDVENVDDRGVDAHAGVAPNAPTVGDRQPAAGLGGQAF